jgi:hypothetical protein
VSVGVRGRPHVRRGGARSSQSGETGISTVDSIDPPRLDLTPAPKPAPQGAQVDKRTPNDLSAAVPKFCLTVEEFRRTPEGRVRTPQEFLQHFFPHDSSKVTDRLFKFLPNEVRGPVLTSWGLRGAKSALKDTDEKVQSVVWDALLAGDIDHEAFEQAVLSDVIVRWAPLSDWWAFWRAGKLSKLAIHKALDTAYELGLFDAKWFFDTIEGPGGKLKGTDVVSEGLTKAELTEWVRKIHATGDGTPKGLLSALGWDRIVGKTPNDVLIKVLDSFAQKVALAAPAPASAKTEDPADERPSTRITPVPPAPVDPAEAAIMNATIGSMRPRTPSFSSMPAVTGSGPTSAFGGTRASSAPGTSIGGSSAGAGTSTPAGSNAGAPNAAAAAAIPGDGEIDHLFSESKVPPPEDIVVDEDIEITGAHSEESTTNRPPPSAPEPDTVMVKMRQPTSPGTGMPAASTAPTPVGTTPAARGRR